MAFKYASFYPVSREIGAAQARQLSVKARGALLGRGLIGDGDVVTAIPSRLFDVTNLSSDRGRTKAALSISSEVAVDSDEIEKVLGVSYHKDVKGELFWKVGSSERRVVFPVVPRRDRRVMPDKVRFLHELALCSPVLRETPKRGPLDLALYMEDAGVIVKELNVDRHPLSGLVVGMSGVFSIGRLFGSRENVVFGQGKEFGGGLSVPMI